MASAAYENENKNDKPRGGQNDNTENKIATIDKNGGISGDEIVKIVQGFGGTNLKDIVKNSGKTIEESLKDCVKLFAKLAKGQEEQSLTDAGESCGLTKFVATALALELMEKYPKEQSNGMLIATYDQLPQLCFVKNYARLDDKKYIKDFTGLVLYWLGIDNIHNILIAFTSRFAHSELQKNRIFEYLRIIQYYLSVIVMEENIVEFDGKVVDDPLTNLYRIEVDSSKTKGIITSIKRWAIENQWGGYCRLAQNRIKNGKEFLVFHVMLQAKYEKAIEAYKILKDGLLSKNINCEMSVHNINKGKIFSKFELFEVLDKDLRTRSPSQSCIFDQYTDLYGVQREPILTDSILFSGDIGEQSGSSAERTASPNDESDYFEKQFKLTAKRSRGLWEKFVNEKVGQLHDAARINPVEQTFFDTVLVNFLRFEEKNVDNKQNDNDDSNKDNNNNDSVMTSADKDEDTDMVEEKNAVLNENHSDGDGKSKKPYLTAEKQKEAIKYVVLANSRGEAASSVKVPYADFIQFANFDIFESGLMSPFEYANKEYVIRCNCTDYIFSIFCHFFTQFKNLPIPSKTIWKRDNEQKDNKNNSIEKPMDMKLNFNNLKINDLDVDTLCGVYVACNQIDAWYLKFVVVGTIVNKFLTIGDVKKMDQF